jgi:hypothetical protein
MRVNRHHARFSPREDHTLQSLVQSLGTDNWGEIAKHMGTRNARQCRDRWFNYLSSDLNTEHWTREEELLLIQKYAELGARWVAIAKFFNHRTDVMVKNHFSRLQRRSHRICSFPTRQTNGLLNNERVNESLKQVEPIEQAISGNDTSLEEWNDSIGFSDEMFPF